MARMRVVKPGFFKNEDIAELDPMSRLLFIGLWTQADREGRLENRPKRLKAEIFPYDDDYSIEDGLSNLEKSNFIICYEAEGIKIIQVVNFIKHQAPHYKEVPSTLPALSQEFIGSVKALPISAKDRDRILEVGGRICVRCRSTEDLTIDHIIPISKGGLSTDDNLQILCRRCNSSKNNKIDVGSTLNQHQGDVRSTSFDLALLKQEHILKQEQELKRGWELKHKQRRRQILKKAKVRQRQKKAPNPGSARPLPPVVVNPAITVLLPSPMEKLCEEAKKDKLVQEWAIRQGLKPENIPKLLDEFLQHCKNHRKDHQSIQQFQQHLVNWYPKRKSNGSKTNTGAGSRPSAAVIPAGRRDYGKP